MFRVYAAIWRVGARRQIHLIILAAAFAALAAAPIEIRQEVVNVLGTIDSGHAKLRVLSVGTMGVDRSGEGMAHCLS